MHKKTLVTLAGVAALTMATTPVFAEILATGGTHVSQGLGTGDTFLKTDLSGGTAISFSTTSNTKIWVSVSGQCAINFGSQPDFVDVDILIDGVQIAPTQANTAFCSGKGSFGSAMNGVGGVAAGTHTVNVRARIADPSGGTTYSGSQANISGLSIVVSR